MAHIKIALSTAKDWTFWHHYGHEDMDGSQGIIVTWKCSSNSSRQLACLGLDICGVGRWEQMLSRTPHVAARAFTDDEVQWAAARPERLALLWAIKEAFVKALGCGFGGLGYRDITIESIVCHPSIYLPLTFSLAIPGAQRITDLSWQLILFGQDTLPGALIVAWYPVSCPGSVMSASHTAKTATYSKIVLELRPISARPTTRQEKHTIERRAVRETAYSAASRLLPRSMQQHVQIKKARSGRPLLQIHANERATTSQLPLSLSHCSGWAAAALGGSFYQSDSMQ